MLSRKYENKFQLLALSTPLHAIYPLRFCFIRQPPLPNSIMHPFDTRFMILLFSFSQPSFSNRKRKEKLLNQKHFVISRSCFDLEIRRSPAALQLLKFIASRTYFFLGKPRERVKANLCFYL